LSARSGVLPGARHGLLVIPALSHTRSCTVGLSKPPEKLSVFWRGSDIGIVGGTIQVYSFILWIPALLGLFHLLREKMPRLAVYGSLLAIYACLAGNNFAMDGIYMGAMRALGSGEPTLGSVVEAMSPAGPLVLYIPGAFFPLTLLLVAVALWRAGLVPPWVALLLAVGAIAFPLSRIPRIATIAHLADLLILIPMVWLGLQHFRQPEAAPRVVKAPA
jgi:hypothetical protein